jgi:hypothetical protein
MNSEESALPETVPHELEPPAETQINPVDSNVGEVKVVGRVSSVRRCKQITSLTKEELKRIVSELLEGIDNPFYKYSEKTGLRFINSNVRKRAKKTGSVFDEDKLVEKKPQVEVEAEVPPATNDIDAVPSVIEVDKVEREVRQQPFRQRKLDLMASARRNDLIDKGFIGEQGPRRLNFKDQGEPMDLDRTV